MYLSIYSSPLRMNKFMQWRPLPSFKSRGAGYESAYYEDSLGSPKSDCYLHSKYMIGVLNLRVVNNYKRRKNLNSALPLKDSDTAWDSNYPHSGWETVPCSRWHQYPRKKTTGVRDSTPSVSNRFESLAVSLSFNGMVTRSSNQGCIDGFRREKLQRFATFDSLSVQRRLEAR